MPDKKLSRREFLKVVIASAAAAGLSHFRFLNIAGPLPALADDDCILPGDTDNCTTGVDPEDSCKPHQSEQDECNLTHDYDDYCVPDFAEPDACMPQHNDPDLCAPLQSEADECHSTEGDPDYDCTPPDVCIPESEPDLCLLPESDVCVPEVEPDVCIPWEGQSDICSLAVCRRESGPSVNT